MAEYDDQFETSAHEARKAGFRTIFKAECKSLLHLCVCMNELKLKKEKLEAELKEVNAGYDVLRMEMVPEP